MITLAVEADDEHRTTVAIATGLIGRELRSVAPPRGGIANTFAEAAMTKFVGAAKEFYGIVGVVGS